MAIDTSDRVSADPEPSPAGSQAPASARTRLTALAILLPLVLMAVAGTLRFYRLGDPDRCYFDETYYYYDARDLRQQGVEDGFVVHPPLGKWLIAGGLALFGVPDGAPLDADVIIEPSSCNATDRDSDETALTEEEAQSYAAAERREEAESFARRSAAALFGTLSVGVCYLAGLRLFRRRGVAALGAVLLAVDGLAFTMSRIAMLDVFLGFWTLVGFWLLLVDRDRQWAGVRAAGEPFPEGERPPGLPHRSRAFRWLAGLAFGLALATKVSALLAIAAAGLFVLGSDLAWRKRITGRLFAQPWRIVASGLLTLVAVPAAVYVVSYATWFAGFEHTEPGKRDCPEEGCPTTVSGQVARMAGDWWEEQGKIFRFHRDLDADHPYRATASSWPLLLRPVAYYYENCTPEDVAAGEECAVAESNIAEILGIGNPMIWWMAVPAYLILAWFAVRHRDATAAIILTFLLLHYLPWLTSPRAVFLFYMTPAVPFICLALADAAGRAMGVRGLRWVPAAVAVVAVAGFVFWYPVLSGLEVSKAAWDLRIWIRPGWI